MSSRSAEVIPDIEDDISEKLEPLYHVILLPAEVPDSELVALTQCQVFGNRLDTCLVLADDHGLP